jgi:hypothetical protein
MGVQPKDNEMGVQPKAPAKSVQPKDGRSLKDEMGVQPKDEDGHPRSDS